MVNKKILTLTLLLSFMLSSCFEAASNKRVVRNDDGIKGTGPNNISNLDGNNLITVDGGGFSTDKKTPLAKIEIRHLVEPKIDANSDGGDYKRKLTIPKNYDGLLYVTGINITSLAGENISVRFSFGVEGSSITVPATVSSAPGLTPQTNIEVLVLDLRSRPFNNIQLLYDLFDYNVYDFPGTGSDPGALTEPVAFNRNDKLFCRGLALKDDNTFAGNLVDGCIQNNDTCKYAYAKIVDKGLVQSGVPDIPGVPSELNIMKGVSYDTDDLSTKLSRCLPDNPLLTGGAYLFDSSFSFFGFESIQTINSTNYIYRGPYRPINQDKWEIKSEALKGQFGLFSGIYDMNVDGSVDAAELEYGYGSRLFPLYSQFNLIKDSEYMGSSVPDSEKLLSVMASNGQSLYMDGCNSRASSVDDITGEHIGSCNVTATIEIIVTNDETKKITVLDITDEVKLQLVKPSIINSSGENVLLSSYQQCSSSAQCGSDSCCVNNRCWSKEIVPQCIEDLPNFGNQQTGELCSSDYECSSLCCNKVDGRCAPHDPKGENPVFCSKSSGQSCIAQEWCQKTPVTTCDIILTGTDPLGKKTCALRCITAEVFGECSAADGMGAGQCVPACQPPQPEFVPTDPTRCDGAKPLSELIDMANNPNTTCAQNP